MFLVHRSHFSKSCWCYKSKKWLLWWSHTKSFLPSSNNWYTGHAEVVEITFDPEKITFENLLDIFFELHDPTTLNQQGHDLGTQYRSMILVTSPEQFAIAMQKISDLNSKHKFQNPIVTEVVKFENFYPAEEDHQNFYNNNRDYSYCKVVIDPKIKKLIDITKNSYNII